MLRDVKQQQPAQLQHASSFGPVQGCPTRLRPCSRRRCLMAMIISVFSFFFYLSLSLPIFPSLSLSLSISLFLPLSLSLCFFLSVCLCQCVYLSVRPSVRPSVSVCLCLSLSVSVCLCLSLSVSVCLCLSLSARHMSRRNCHPRRVCLGKQREASWLPKRN